MDCEAYNIGCKNIVNIVNIAGFKSGQESETQLFVITVAARGVRKRDEFTHPDIPVVNYSTYFCKRSRSGLGQGRTDATQTDKGGKAAPAAAL